MVEVTNKQPEICKEVPEPILKLFQEYTLRKDGQKLYPFRHQGEVFRLVGQESHEIFLVAGTASGKTLAIAIPLFWKLKMGLLRKILFMYPTVALLEDQRKVMDLLAEIIGLEVAQLQGGMSRTQLIEALNKPVILATPDEIYWFFRKNVKYNSLLIYGLALVDEFVLDEGHLFNGLMLRNLAHLKRRIQLLGEKIGKCSGWHILTATPTEELRGLITAGVKVQGQSKCSDVEVTFLEPASGYRERQKKMVEALESSLEDNAKKVLLVFNSADLAHRVFEGIRGRSNDAEIPAEMKLRFGRIRWGQFKTWMESEKIGSQIQEDIENWLKREEPFRLKDLTDGERAKVPTEELASKIAKLLESQAWTIKRLAYSADREKNSGLVSSIEARLIGKSKFARLIWAYLQPRMKDSIDIECITGEIDRFVTELQNKLEKILSEDSLDVTAPAFKELSSVLIEAGLPPDLAITLANYLRYSVELPAGTAESLRMSPLELSRRYVSFSWFSWLIKNEAQRKDLTGRILKGLEEGCLNADTKNISTWKDNNNVPAIIYTGKMSKNERKGLLEAFEQLPRAILISTPAVEVGVDFAADTLITEQCDGNGFLQRFGRVGRRFGVRGRVIVLIKDGESYTDLYNRLKNIPGEGRKMTRADFSSLIASPEAGIFPSKNYIEGSDFIDATHWLVNAQVGEIGGWLNQSMFGEGPIANLAQKIRKSGLFFAYGLRGTMPGVSLRGGANGGDPFYILSKIYNDHLVYSDSPFDIAQADLWHTELLWKKSQWKIVVDAATTLEASQALFWRQYGRWKLKTGYGIAADYVRLFQPEIERNLRGLESSFNKEPDGLLSKLEPHVTNPKVRPILRLWDALPLFFSPYAKLVLGMGDVYLQRENLEGIVEPVEDRMGNPLVIQNQIWLILFGYNNEQAERRLEDISALHLEEVICDLKTLDVQGSRIIGPVIMEKTAGACFNIYRRMVEHAG